MHNETYVKGFESTHKLWGIAINVSFHNLSHEICIRTRQRLVVSVSSSFYFPEELVDVILSPLFQVHNCPRNAGEVWLFPYKRDEIKSTKLVIVKAAYKSLSEKFCQTKNQLRSNGDSRRREASHKKGNPYVAERVWSNIPLRLSSSTID